MGDLSLAARLDLHPQGYVSGGDKAIKTNDRLDSSMRKVGRSGRVVSNGMRTATAANDSYTRSSKSADIQNKITTASIIKMKNAVTLAAGVFTGAASIGFAKYQQKLAEVNTLLSETDSIDNYTSSISQLNKDFGGGVNQVSALYQVISSGAGSVAEANEILNSSNKLAIGGVAELTISADGLTSVLNSYNLEASHSAKVSDIFFASMRSGKTTVGELAANVGKVTPLAAQLGVEFDEVAAIIATLTTNGVSTAEATTQLKASLANILTPTKQASDLAKELGLDFSSAGLKALGFAGFLQEVKEKTGGTDEALSTLFGSVEAVQAIMPLAGKSAEKFSEILDRNRHSAGETDKAYAKMSDTLIQNFRETTAEGQELAIKLGSKLAPALNLVLVTGGELFGLIGDNLDVVENLGTLLLALLVANKVGPALNILGAGAVAAGRGMTALNASLLLAQGRITTVSALAGGLRTALAFLGGPAGWAILAGAALLTMGNNANEAEEDIASIREEIDRLTKSAAELSQQALQSGFDATQGKIRDLKSEIAELTAEMQINESVGAEFGGNNDQIAKRIEALNFRLSENQERLEAQGIALNKANAAALDAVGGFESYGESVESSNNKITQSNAAVSESSDEVIKTAKDRLNAVISSLETESESVRSSYEQQVRDVENAEQLKIISAQESSKIRAKLEADLADKVADIEADKLQSVQDGLDSIIRSNRTASETAKIQYEESLAVLVDAENRGLIAHQESAEQKRRIEEKYNADISDVTDQSLDKQINQYGLFSDELKALREGDIEGALNGFENIADNWEDMLKQMLKQWTLSGLGDLLSGKGFSGFSLSNLFGGGGGGGGGGFNLSSIFGGGGATPSFNPSSVLNGTSLGNTLGIGSGSGTIVGNGINSLFGGSSTVGNGINALFGGSGGFSFGGGLASGSSVGLGSGLSFGAGSGASASAGLGSSLSFGTGASASAGTGLGSSLQITNLSSLGSGTAGASTAGAGGAGAGGFSLGPIAGPLLAFAAFTGFTSHQKKQRNIPNQQLADLYSSGNAFNQNIGGNTSYIGSHDQYVGFIQDSDSNLSRTSELLHSQYGFEDRLLQQGDHLRINTKGTADSFDTNPDDILAKVREAIRIADEETQTLFDGVQEKTITNLGEAFEVFGKDAEESIHSLSGAFAELHAGAEDAGNIPVIFSDLVTVVSDEMRLSAEQATELLLGLGYTAEDSFSSIEEAVNAVGDEIGSSFSDAAAAANAALSGISIPSFDSSEEFHFSPSSASSSAPLEEFSKGTNYLEQDGPIYAHRGEMIIDPQASNVLRKYGIKAQVQGGSSSGMSADVVRLLGELKESIDRGNVERRAGTELVSKTVKNTNSRGIGLTRKAA